MSEDRPKAYFDLPDDKFEPTLESILGRSIVLEGTLYGGAGLGLSGLATYGYSNFIDQINLFEDPIQTLVAGAVITVATVGAGLYGLIKGAEKAQEIEREYQRSKL